MLLSSGRKSTVLPLFTLLLSTLVSAHTIITYPGWRGNNLISNGTVHAGVLGIDSENGQRSFPYGMQWMYPCGGLATTQNRTKWPVKGGAVALQPGWNANHPTALIYVNLGIGNEPLNYSSPVVPFFQVTSATSDTYNSTFCLPQVPLPAGYQPNIGDNATIQVIETALHGASLYSCVDITFADPKDVEEVTEQNCYNSTDLGFNLVFTSTSLTSAASSTIPQSLIITLIPLFATLLLSASLI